MWVRLVSTGRTVWCDADQAVRWMAEGYAVPVGDEPSETAALSDRPVPARRAHVEHRA